MYCNQCGKINPKSSKFCQHCGKKIVVVKSINNDNDHSLTPEKPPYPYIISVPKLVILMILTGGLYALVWFYKQFRSFKHEADWNIHPLLRAIFGNIMAYSLFKKVSQEVHELDSTQTLPYTALFVAFLLLSFAGFLPTYYSLISLFFFLPLIPVQKKINFYWHEKYGDTVKHSTFGKKNYLWAILSGVFFLPIVILANVVSDSDINAFFAADQKVAPTSSALNEDDLLKAINTERRKNNIGTLVTDESSCKIAELRAHDVANDINVFGSSASFQRAIDTAFEENPSLDVESTPDFYNELLTYEASIEDAITDWKTSEASMLFTDSDLAVGCVAFKDGYGIVIVGSYSDEQVPTDSVSGQDESVRNIPGSIHLL